MYLSYNSTKIIPAPWVSFSTEIVRSDDGQKVGKTLVATLKGKFVHTKGGATWQGSGYPDDDFSKCALEDLLSKQDDLRELFADDYQWFEIQPDPEATAETFSWVAKVRSIEFPEDLWNPVCDYTVVLELQHDPWDGVSNIDETWELTQNEDPRDTYSLTHTISASSREYYNTATSSTISGWQKALEEGIISKLGGQGIDGGIVYSDPGLDLSVDFEEYNLLVTKTLNEVNGQYTITETWTMSEVSYTEEQTIAVETTRDAIADHDVRVTVEGTITGFKDPPSGTGWSNCLSRWGVVEPNLYADAASLTPTISLRTSPVTKNVTYDELNRTITYSYVYDEGSTNCDTDISVSVNKNEPECDTWTVTVEGSIQGIKTTTSTAYENALSCFNALDIDGEADDAYSNSGGTGTLIGPVKSNETHNENQGTISFSYTYYDRATSFTHQTTTTVQYNRDTDITNVNITGTIVGDCSGSWDDVQTELATVTSSSAYTDASNAYDGYHTLCEFPANRSKTIDQFNRNIQYTYEFSDSPSCSVEVQQNITIKNNPEKCGKYLVSVDGNIKGRRTNSDTPWNNALSEYQTNHTQSDCKTAAATYVSGTLYTQTDSVTYSEDQFSIRYNYEFTNEAAYEIVETITESWGGDDECGITKITQEGTVTGLCTGDGDSAYDNAVTGFATISDPDDAQNLIRQSVSRNESRGIINYTKEFDNRSVPYVVEYTETLRETLEDCANSVVIEGSVQGICENNTASTKFQNASTGYATIENLTPTSSSSTGWIRTGKTKGSNSYAGRISFSFEYKEKSACVAGGYNESVEVNDDLSTDIFAVVPVLGGTEVIQDKSATTSKKRTVVIQVQVAPDCTCSFDTGVPDVETYIENAKPTGTIVKVAQNTKNWNPRSGRYTRTKAWVYGDC